MSIRRGDADQLVRGTPRTRYRGTASLADARRPPMPRGLTPEPPMPDHVPLETITNLADENERADVADRRRGNQGRFSD